MLLALPLLEPWRMGRGRANWHSNTFTTRAHVSFTASLMSLQAIRLGGRRLFESGDHDLSSSVRIATAGIGSIKTGAVTYDLQRVMPHNF